MTRSTAARVAGAVVGALLLLGLTASPASADPPRPTNYRSTVTSVEPSLPEGAEVRIVGGDSLIELSLPEGHTAVVADYASADADPVPYLRFDDDGTVRRNALAVATTANDSRYGSSDRVPDPGAEPRWETVATNGTYAWHDHRIHWMSPKAPRVVAADGRVDLGGEDGSWTVPITVDGEPTVITGELVLEPAPSPLPWILLAAVVLAGAVALAVRGGLRLAGGVGLPVSLAATYVTAVAARAVPPGAGGWVVPLVLAVLAPIAAVVSLLPSPRVRLVAVAALAACLVGWGVSRWTVLVRAVLPTTVPFGVDRAVTALALGYGIGLAVALVWKPPARRPARPAPPEAPEVTASPTA